MSHIIELSRLKSEVASYETTCFEDMRLFTYQIIDSIRQLTREGLEIKNDFFRSYIRKVILPDLVCMEDFLKSSQVKDEQIEFKIRSIKYHFHFIIDSCIYADMINNK